eukprot:5634721-Prymnesium_polylepis.4
MRRLASCPPPSLRPVRTCPALHTLHPWPRQQTSPSPPHPPHPPRQPRQPRQSSASRASRRRRRRPCCAVLELQPDALRIGCAQALELPCDDRERLLRPLEAPREHAVHLVRAPPLGALGRVRLSTGHAGGVCGGESASHHKVPSRRRVGNARPRVWLLGLSHSSPQGSRRRATESLTFGPGAQFSSRVKATRDREPLWSGSVGQITVPRCSHGARLTRVCARLCVSTDCSTREKPSPSRVSSRVRHLPLSTARFSCASTNCSTYAAASSCFTFRLHLKSHVTRLFFSGGSLGHKST